MMQIQSYRLDGVVSFGLRSADGLVDLGRRFANDTPNLMAALMQNRLADLMEFAAGHNADTSPDQIEVLPVIPCPGKIICVGVNYDAHRIETGREAIKYPTLFTRFPDTLVGAGQALVLPRASTMLDYEGELAVVIGKSARHVSRDNAMQHVAGYSCFNDATVRDWQQHSSQFTAGKNFPATGAFGPGLVLAESVGDVSNLVLQTRLNGELLQDATTAECIFDIPALIEYISTFTTLEPGDVIATGTPAGVGFKRNPPLFLQDGDSVEVNIEGVGTLTNPVVAEAE